MQAFSYPNLATWPLSLLLSRLVPVLDLARMTSVAQHRDSVSILIVPHAPRSRRSPILFLHSMPLWIPVDSSRLRADHMAARCYTTVSKPCIIR